MNPAGPLRWSDPLSPVLVQTALIVLGLWLGVSRLSCELGVALAGCRTGRFLLHNCRWAEYALLWPSEGGGVASPTHAAKVASRGAQLCVRYAYKQKFSSFWGRYSALGLTPVTNMNILAQIIKKF